MKERGLTLPEIGLIGGTRLALGIGFGLLLSEKMSRDARRGAGWTLVAVGAISSIPLGMGVMNKPPLRPTGFPERT